MSNLDLQSIIKENFKDKEIDLKALDSLSAKERQLLRIYLGKISHANFVQIYLPHHFSFSKEKLQKINIEYDLNIDLNHADRVIFNKTSYPTFKVYDEILKYQNKKYGLVKFRGGGKTTENFSLLLRASCYAMHKFMVYIGETGDKAESMIKDLVEEVEENELIRLDFPGLIPKKSLMTKRAITFSKKEIRFENGVTIIANSSHSSARGLKRGNERPGLCIVDDCEKDEHVRTPYQRKKLEDWFRKVILPLGGGTGCSILITGTIIHYDCLIAKIVLNNMLPNFETKIFPVKDEDGNLAWPLIFPDKRLVKEEIDYGAQAYASEFLCKPMAEDDQIFTPEMAEKTEFEFTNKEDYPNKLAFIDMAQTGRGDYTACTIIGTKERHIYVLYAYIKKININHVLPELAPLLKEWEVQTVGIEKNNQEMFISEFEKYCNEQIDYYPHIVPIHHIGEKKQKIASTIAPKWQADLLHFRKDRVYAYPKLMEQLYGFPLWGHDDGPDSLCGCLELVKKYDIEFMRFVR